MKTPASCAPRPSRETIGARSLKHGHAIGGGSLTYRSWAAMVNRCTNAATPNYAQYGKIGIKVCARWRRSFTAFLEDVGPRPSRAHSIDRYPDPAGNYKPRNVRWATRKQQRRNRKTTRAVVRSDGAKYPSIIDAAEGIAGGNRRSIQQCCAGKRMTHLGFAWRYA